MTDRRRRASSRVTLVLLGAAALAGCSEQPGMRRDLYATKQDCISDWGDEKRCEVAPAATTSGSSGRSSSGYYYGPSYRPGDHGHNSDANSTAPRSNSRAVSSSMVSRGGFGSSGSSHASSSSGS